MRFRWNDCELDREARSLSRAGLAVPIQPLVLDLLLLLVSNRGRVVSWEYLRRELWRDVQVTDASLRRLLKEARRAIGDDGKKQSQILTAPRRGVRFAVEVTTHDGWDTSFVGRTDLIEALEQKLEEVTSGIGGVTLLYGPAGIGKSRTLLEVQARADARGFRVMQGCGRVGGDGDAFHPWLEAVHDAGIDELLRPARGDPAGRSSQPSSADARRFATFRSVAQSLTRLARERPLLIALDDVQFADQDTIALLRFVAPSLARARVWIIAVYRTGAGSESETRLRELAALSTETSTQSFELRGLMPAELRTLVRNQIRAEVGMPLATLLAGRTAGNPLIALEVARSLQRDGALLSADVTREVDAKVVRGIEPLVARRLSALSPETQRLLRSASALGAEFDATILQAAEGGSARALTRALHEAEAANLVARLTGSRWQFAHPLFAEALYAELDATSDGGAAAQHLRIAEALERLGSPDSFAIARHFVRSRPAVSAARVLPYACAVAREAYQRSAFADAELWYREAVALADDAGLEAGEICDLLLALGDVLVAGVGVSRARIPFERAADLAVRNGDARRLGLAAVGFAHRPAGMGDAEPAVLHWLAAAHAAPSGDPAVDALVASRFGAELASAGPEQAAASVARMQEAVAAARALGDPFTLGRVLGDRVSSTLPARDPRAWIAWADEVAHYARAGGDSETEFRALEARATGYLHLADRDAVEDAVARCQRFANRQPFRFARTVTRGMEAMLAFLDGRFDDARAAIDEAERDSGGATSVGLAAQIACQRFWLALEQGQLREAAPVLERAFVRFPNLPALTAASGLVHALLGNDEPARRALEAVVKRIPVIVPHDRSKLPALVLAGEIAYRIRDTDAVPTLERQLRPYAGVSSVVATASIYTGAVSQGLGWLAAARGDRVEATSHFEEALRVHTALRSPVWRSRSLSAIAEMSRTSGS